MKLRLFEIVWILFLAFHLLPMVPEYIPMGVRVGLWAIVGVVFLFKTKISDIKKILPLYSIAFLFVIYAFFYNANNISDLLYAYLQFITITLAYFYIKDNNDLHFARSTLIFAALFLTITAITTIIGNSVYPNASRILASANNNSQMYHPLLRRNVGGFDFTYMLVLAIPYLIYSLKNRTLPVLLSLLFLLISCFAIVSTEYTIAIIFMVVGVFSVFLPKRMRSGSIIPIALAVALIYFLFRDILPSILDSIASVIDSDNVSSRIQDISSSLKGEGIEEESDMSGRIDLMKKSIDAFTNNVLFGTYNSVGGHSYFLDSMGRFGIWGIIGLFLMISSYRRLFILPFKKEPYYGYLTLYFIIYIGLLILNPQPFYIATTLIIPLLFKYGSVNREYQTVVVT